MVDVAYPLTKYISGQFQQVYSVKIELLNPNIGNFVGMNNNVVTTNNTDLNAIFQTHNVFSYINNSIVICYMQVFDNRCLVACWHERNSYFNQASIRDQ